MISKLYYNMHFSLKDAKTHRDTKRKKSSDSLYPANKREFFHVCDIKHLQCYDFFSLKKKNSQQETNTKKSEIKS